MAGLRQLSLNARRQALAHASEFARLYQNLNQQGVSCRPLKCPILSLLLYDGPGIRQAHDLDILIHLTDFEQAEKMLLAEGYLRKCPEEPLSPAPRRFMTSAVHHFEYHHPERHILLELHCREPFFCRQDHHCFWENNATLSFMGVSYTVFSDDLQLLYLCAHGARHKFFRLKWLGDIVKIITENRISSWERVIELAKELEVHRSLALSAEMIKQLFFVPLPDALAQLVKEEALLDLVPEMIEALLGIEESGGTLFKLITCQKRLNPSLPTATILQGMLIRMVDFKLLRFPEPLFWLYRPLRPAFWFCRHYVAVEDAAIPHYSLQKKR